jgi:hypothetical protein
MQRWFALFTAFLVAGCTTAGPTAAQATYPETSPPLIAGRVALAEGDARIWRVEDDAGGNAGEWDEAETNDVVSAGTGLYTGPDGRNEVRVGPHTFRLAANSRGGFSQLDYSSAVFDLEYGSLNVRLARAEHGETTAVTVAGVRLELAAPGRYRVDATDRGPLRLTVFDGHGTVRAPNTTVGVAGSQAIVLTPGVTGYNFEQPVSSDFDQWALARDDRFRDVRSAQYVSPYMTGTKNSTCMATGCRMACTGRCGIRAPCRSAGLPIATASGAGSGHGAGPGSTRRRGATRRSITAAGCWSGRAGPGCRAATCRGRCGRRPWWDSSAAGSVCR